MPTSETQSPETPFDPVLREQVIERATSLLDELDELAGALHADPETAFDEHRSVARIADLLTRHGADVEVGVYGLPTAFRAGAGTSGPKVAILAEYDALPEIGHACGHNLIAAMSTGAFVVARDLLSDAHDGAPASGAGTVELIGSPAEEGGGGKELILRAGGFDDVDAALMVHPGNTDRLDGMFLGMRHVEVTYTGTAAHAAAAPERGYNALDAVVTAYQSVAQVRQHILPTDRVHGIITDGGQAPNIVPHRAAAHFYVRSAGVDSLRHLSARVDAALRGAATATGTTAEIVWDRQPAYLPVRTNSVLTRSFAGVLSGRRDLAARSGGGASTDMGNVSQVVPAIHPSLDTTGADIPAHTAEFAASTRTPPARDALLEGVIGIAGTVLDVLSDPQVLAAARAEFAETGGPVRWQD
ncbi:amidohydrolase [Pseudactinotalea sp. Z1732]|uniref:amidohydrolase n=1 Tax=Micrococcales TaxID=85006 RepID=UPI003C7DDEB8